MSKFNEATRVQMPALVHLTRLGYKYFGKIHETEEGSIYDGDTNILLGVFKQKFEQLNPGHEGVAKISPKKKRVDARAVGAG